MNIYGRSVRRFFQRAVDRAMSELPPNVARRMENVTVAVEEKPDPADDQCGQCLFWLHHAPPPVKKGDPDRAGAAPDRFSIYISSHLALQLDDAELKDQLRQTVQEIVEHLGVGAERQPKRYGRSIHRLFQRAVDRAMSEIPPDIARKIDNLSVAVEDRPDPEDDPCGQCLFGLFQGIPKTERGLDYAGVMPDRISIYISSHLALQLDDAELKAEIRRTVLHEVGHHLGFDDHRLEELGWG